MPTPIPITLNANPVPVGIQAVNINDLLNIVAEYVSGTISQNVSFFIQGSTPPQSNQGIFYNTTTRRFEDWSSTAGAYLPITENSVGDLKVALSQVDDPANGWILLNGRSINSLSNITQLQKSNLETLFGVNSSLPNYSFLGALVGLPSSGAFSAITNNPIQPNVGAIGSINIGSTYDQTQITTLRNNTETLLGSTNNLQSVVSQVQATSDQVLNALLSGSAVLGPRWFVFCGYPS